MGAKSGVERTTPLVHSTTDASTDGRPAGDVVIIAPMGGARRTRPGTTTWSRTPTSPSRSAPTRTGPAREAHGDERQRLFDQQAERMLFFQRLRRRQELRHPGVRVLERLAG
ncbi:MAG: hypothetical protein R2713_19245 [Ilumatobacteraceae bacterium]